jgi:hypothetical protein
VGAKGACCGGVSRRPASQPPVATVQVPCCFLTAPGDQNCWLSSNRGLSELLPSGLMRLAAERLLARLLALKHLQLAPPRRSVDQQATRRSRSDVGTTLGSGRLNGNSGVTTSLRLTDQAALLIAQGHGAFSWSDGRHGHGALQLLGPKEPAQLWLLASKNAAMALTTSLQESFLQSSLAQLSRPRAVLILMQSVSWNRFR